MTHGPGQVRRLATTLSEILADSPVRVPHVAVPSGAGSGRGAVPRRRWSGSADDRAGAGYAVHGDPASLAPTGSGPNSGLPGTIDPRQTLEVAVEACLRTWRRQEGLT